MQREDSLCVGVGVCYIQRKEEEGVGRGIVSVFKSLHSCHKKRLSFSLSLFFLNDSKCYFILGEQISAHLHRIIFYQSKLPKYGTIFLGESKSS